MYKRFALTSSTKPPTQPYNFQPRRERLGEDGSIHSPTGKVIVT